PAVSETRGYTLNQLPFVPALAPPTPRAAPTIASASVTRSASLIPSSLGHATWTGRDYARGGHTGLHDRDGPHARTPTPRARCLRPRADRRVPRRGADLPRRLRRRGPALRDPDDPRTRRRRPVPARLAGEPHAANAARRRGRLRDRDATRRARARAVRLQPLDELPLGGRA